MPDRPTAIMGGDPTLVSAAMLDPVFRRIYLSSEAAQSMEVRCQQCGRGILLAPSGQRLALDGGAVVPLDPEALRRNEVRAGGPSERAEACPAICMWCASAGIPSLIAALDQALTNARAALAKARGEA